MLGTQLSKVSKAGNAGKLKEMKSMGWGCLPRGLLGATIAGREPLTRFS